MNRMIEAYDKLDAMLRKERDDYEMQACELSHKIDTIKSKLLDLHREVRELIDEL